MPALSRRVLSVSLVTGLALGLTAAAPLLLSVALLADLARRRRWATVRFFVFVLVLAWAETVGSAIALVIGGDLERNYALQRAWAGTLGRAAFWIWGMHLDADVAGADLHRGPYVLALRHVALADTLLPMLLAAIPHGLRPRYVLKDELRWDPCLDIVGSRLPNTFVRRDLADAPAEDAARLQEAQRATLAGLATGMGTGDFAAIYPEGTRFTPARRARLLARLEGPARARAEGLLTVLPPRVGGLSALLDGCPTADVVILGHRGLERAARLPDLWRGQLIGARWEVWAERHPRASVPDGREQRAAWLHERWAAMDARIRAGGPPVG